MDIKSPSVGLARVGARVVAPDGVRLLDGSSPFGVLVMGYDAYDSYAYPGGLGQATINP